MFQNNCNLFYLGCFQAWIHDTFQVGLSYKTNTARGTFCGLGTRREQFVIRNQACFHAYILSRRWKISVFQRGFIDDLNVLSNVSLLVRSSDAREFQSLISWQRLGPVLQLDYVSPSCLLTVSCAFDLIAVGLLAHTVNCSHHKLNTNTHKHSWFFWQTHPSMYLSICCHFSLIFW